MGKTLIIAEKPSVAADVAKALGGFVKHEDYFENDTYVLSSAVGHLLEICAPPGVEVQRGKWTFNHLPVIPAHFDLKPLERNLPRLNLLVRLIKRKDVTGLINACDAGREGELIFRHIVQFSETPKPIRRLWLQSMTPAAIRDGFAALRDDAVMRPLADAAFCRSEADWLVGINSTRAMTAFNSKLGGFQLTTVGRVQTPTLAILVEREEKIKQFVSKDYFEVHATFAAAAGSYPGRWFDPRFNKEKNGDGDERPERLWERARAEAIVAACQGQAGTVTEETKPTTQLSPLLYDLTSLQRDANGRFGFSARRTLQVAQSLYEKHKVLTYPRTDARALPEDYAETVKQTLRAFAPGDYGKLAAPILAHAWVRPNPRVFNNAKISDHFAIIPTAQVPKALNDEEVKIYDLVVRRFLAIFYPAAEFLVTTRLTLVKAESFKTEGKVLVTPGWLAVYGKEAQNDSTPQLVPIQAGETVQTLALELVECATKPPSRFTEATLLSAMEGAGKLVEDEELRAAMSAKGLGTPATRAAIIEGLISENYVLRQGRELQPTAKAFSLLALLRGLAIPELCRPELTGNWEFKLKQMERGQLARPDFMREIAAMTRAIVGKAKGYDNATVPGDFGTLTAPCPRCGGQIRENYRKFQCQGCDFALWKSVAGRQFEPQEVETLLTQRKVGPFQGFRSKLGRPFSASLILTNEFKLEFNFNQDRPAPGTAAEPVDFSRQEPLGKCPKCGAGVFDVDTSYICQKATGTERTCDFRSGKVILQQPIDRLQMIQLLETGKTDLLKKFISKKGRPFAAFLSVGKDGRVGFEFAPREPKGPAKASKAPQAAGVRNRKSK